MTAPNECAIQIHDLSQRSAFVALLENTFNTVVVDSERLQRQFEIVTRIASKAPVKSIYYSRNLADLPRMRDLILADLAQIMESV
jgi:hypothetical protein